MFQTALPKKKKNICFESFWPHQYSNFTNQRITWFVKPALVDLRTILGFRLKWDCLNPANIFHLARLHQTSSVLNPIASRVDWSGSGSWPQEVLLPLSQDHCYVITPSLSVWRMALTFYISKCWQNQETVGTILAPMAPDVIMTPWDVCVCGWGWVWGRARWQNLVTDTRLTTSTPKKND